MSDLSDLPDRPLPPQPVRQRLAAWIEWIGVGRLVSSAVVVIAVVAAVYWLVAPPAVASEAALPRADTSSTSTVVPTVVQSGVATADPVVVIVHVAGAVVAPGVYRLESGARAIDAVERAGGVVLDADLDSVNLAAPLADGQRLYIPRVGEVPVVVALPEAGDSAGTPTGIVGPVNINRATSDELETLPGVGPTTAAAIITHRTQRGPFVTVDDLGDVSGIGTAKLAALRGLVTV